MLKDVLEGGEDETDYLNGIEILSLNKRVKDVIYSTIESGDLELPKGKVIDSIKIVNGELVIEYQ